MRKGRSQRKARSSLLPLGQAGQTGLASSRPAQAADGSGATSARGSGRGPQVVIGLTDNPVGSNDASREALEARAPEPTLVSAGVKRVPITTQIGVPKLDAVEPVTARPSLEVAPEPERLALVREQSLEIVRESLELVRESLAETAALAESETSAAFAVPTFALVESAAISADEQSIPPVVQDSDPVSLAELAVEPVAEEFFSQGELAQHMPVDEDEWDRREDKAVRKSLPHVVQRRAHLAKYVRWAVGGAFVVCLAAAGVSLIPHKNAPARAAAAAIEAPKAAEVAAVAPEVKRAPVAEQAAPAAPAAEAAKVEAPVAKVEEPVAAAAAPVAEAAKAEPAKAEEPAKVVTGDKTALEEKKDARRALERGKSADAIAAGERSVALDPTDGEAWLLLGAAYQDKGKNKEARRCYTACVKEGKRGPIGECRQMIR